MSKQAWMKWVVGLAGVASFSAFMGVLNQYKGMEDVALSSSQKEEFSSDPVQEEWMQYTQAQDDRDEEFEYEHDDDDDDDDEYKYFNDRSIKENRKKETIRTRAS